MDNIYTKLYTYIILKYFSDFFLFYEFILSMKLLFPNLWFFRDLESPDIPVFSVDAHKEIINCIDGVGGLGIGEGAPEIVTGSRDGEYSRVGNK